MTNTTTTPPPLKQPEMPERISARIKPGFSIVGQWAAAPHVLKGNSTTYVRADLVAAKEAEIARLRDEIRSAERAAAHAAYSLIATLIRSGTPLDGIRFIADSSAEALSPEGTSK